MNNIFQKEKWFSSTTTGKVYLSKLTLLVFWERERKIGPFSSWPHCGIFKTSNEKAPHKLEVKIAKNPFMSHTFLKGKGQLAFPPSLLCWSKRETPRIKADFGISDWLRSMRPPCCCNVDPQEPASLRG